MMAAEFSVSLDVQTGNQHTHAAAVPISNARHRILILQMVTVVVWNLWMLTAVIRCRSRAHYCMHAVADGPVRNCIY